MFNNMEVCKAIYKVAVPPSKNKHPNMPYAKCTSDGNTQGGLSTSSKVSDNIHTENSKTSFDNFQKYYKLVILVCMIHGTGNYYDE